MVEVKFLGCFFEDIFVGELSDSWLIRNVKGLNISFLVKRLVFVTHHSGNVSCL